MADRPRTKRGPYRKYLAVETTCAQNDDDVDMVTDGGIKMVASSRHNNAIEHMAQDTTTPDDDIQEQFGSGSDFMCSSLEDNLGSEAPDTPDEYDAYQPPVNDHEDEALDMLLNELQDIAKRDHPQELVDDDNPLEVIADDIFDVVEEEILEVQTTQAKEDPDEEPLYPGSRRKVGVATLLLILFMIRFRLSDEAMQYLITFIGLLLPDDNKFFGSLYHLRKYLQKLTFLPTIQYYCAFCYTHVNKDDRVCANPICKKDLTPSGSLAYFVRHSLLKQLSVLFKRSAFTEMIRKHRFQHFQSVDKGVIADVYDGELYRDLFQSGFLDNPNNISFSLNTDGVNIFKSSSTSMWPVYLLINELPIKQRKLRENTVFYGVWISKKKPMMWSFFKPLFDDLRELEDGIELADHHGDPFICKATLLTCVCDLPAKCLVTNSMQFNGKFGCWHCMQEGETFRMDSGGHCHVFPYKHENPDGPQRTSASVEADVKTVVGKINEGSSSYITNGVKGPFWFMFLKHFNCVDGMVIDYMHGICSGVMKLLLSLWFGSACKHLEFSFFKSRHNVNSMLSKIKPTIHVTRVPRSLDEMGWKSSEYRNFLLYWGIPILSEVLSDLYFIHFKLLVRGLFLLSKETISAGDMAQADQCLKMFVEEFAELYSLRYMTMNVHQVLHLCRCVKFTGPLFANNCFIFEDLNGFLTQYIHGTQGIDTQVINTINVIHALPVLEDKFGYCDPVAKEFIDKMNNQTFTTWIQIMDDIYSIGSVNSYRNLSEAEYSSVCQKFVPIVPERRMKCWYKVYMKSLNIYVYGSQYGRLKRRNQSVIKYRDDSTIKFGSVRFFAQINDILIFAIVTPFQGNYDVANNITPVIPCMNDTRVVLLKDILNVCIFVEVGDKYFVCEMPNRYDKD